MSQDAVIDWVLKHGSQVVPYDIYVRLLNRKRRQEDAARFEREFRPMQRLTAPNAALKLRHQGARTFVLCSGPSTLQQNLAPLAGEIVFSVSTGYLHPLYDQLKPRYHCIPQITFNAQVTEKDVVALFTEMHERTGDAEIFLSATEEKLVRAHGLFPGRTLHYLFLHEDFDHLASRDIPDIATTMPGVQSVPIMASIVAFYMGFKEIYLLGTEHSDLRTREYRYAFQPTVLKGKDFSVDEDGKILTRRYDDLHGFARLWRQYRVIREIAEDHGIRLANATAGGDLDELTRVRLEDIVG